MRALLIMFTIFIVLAMSSFSLWYVAKEDKKAFNSCRSTVDKQTGEYISYDECWLIVYGR